MDVKHRLQNNGGKGTRKEPEKKRGDTLKKMTEIARSVGSLQVRKERKKSVFIGA